MYLTVKTSYKVKNVLLKNSSYWSLYNACCSHLVIGEDVAEAASNIISIIETLTNSYLGVFTRHKVIPLELYAISFLRKKSKDAASIVNAIEPFKSRVYDKIDSLH